MTVHPLRIMNFKIFINIYLYNTIIYEPKKKLIHTSALIKIKITVQEYYQQ
jgi:hypothetical protein